MQGDKKKTMVLGALFLIILAVGAFQLTGSSAPQPASAKKTQKAATADQAPASSDKIGTVSGKVAKNDTPAPTVADLAERDPFDGQAFQPKPVQNTPPPAPAPKSDIKSPFKPGKPLPPLPEGSVPLPVAGPGAAAPAGSLGLQPAPKLPKADDFNYSVSGAISGDHPAAVFTDDKGNQKLVTLGKSIDGDSQLISVARGKVTVRHHGKTVTISVGSKPE